MELKHIWFGYRTKIPVTEWSSGNRMAFGYRTCFNHSVTGHVRKPNAYCSSMLHHCGVIGYSKSWVFDCFRFSKGRISVPCSNQKMVWKSKNFNVLDAISNSIPKLNILQLDCFLPFGNQTSPVLRFLDPHFITGTLTVLILKFFIA